MQAVLVILVSHHTDLEIVAPCGFRGGTEPQTFCKNMPSVAKSKKKIFDSKTLSEMSSLFWYHRREL